MTTLCPLAPSCFAVASCTARIAPARSPPPTQPRRSMRHARCAAPNAMHYPYPATLAALRAFYHALRLPHGAGAMQTCACAVLSTGWGGARLTGRRRRSLAWRWLSPPWVAAGDKTKCTGMCVWGGLRRAVVCTGRARVWLGRRQQAHGVKRQAHGSGAGTGHVLVVLGG